MLCHNFLNIFFILLATKISVFAKDNENNNNDVIVEPANPVEASPTIPVVTTTEREPWVRYPCSCGEGHCGCCTGNVISFGSLTQRACTNITYNPDDFLFNIKMYFNDRMIYQTSISGKNPRPVCVPIRAISAKLCARLSNIYMIGRNVHACLDLEGFWRKQSLFHFSFDCFRIGTSGVGFVKPEDGGGLPAPPEEAPLQPGEEDYDDTARNIK